MNTVSALLSLTWIVLLARTALAVDEDCKHFHKHKVYRVRATTEEQLNVLRTLERQSGDGILFCTSASSLNFPIDVMASPEQDAKILSIFETSGISYEAFIEDVQALIDAGSCDANTTSINWTAYHRLDTVHIYDWLDELAETYPDWVKVIVAGSSYEGRLVKGIKITFHEDNPGIFIEGGIHAREWISPALVTYVTNEILNPTNAEFNLLARAHNWFIFPVTNPDGYEYSHTTDRLWRKNRRPNANGCWGVDLNRNWDYYWMANDGVSNDSCSEIYAGTEPFSEPEAKGLADYIHSVSNQFYIYLSMHSYSQLILLPYGYTYEHLDNYDEAMLVGTKAAEALARRYGTRYVVGSTAETIYVAKGITTDYVKGLYNTPIVYCYELRDTGTYGFLLPAEQIIPSSLEFIDSLVALIREARRLGYP